MSYFLYLVKPALGKDPVKSARAIVRRSHRSQAEGNTTQDELKRRLAEMLLTHDSRLIAIPATAQNRDITLYDPSDTGVPIVITLADDMASLEIHSDSRSDRAILQEVDAYLQIFRQEGFSIYDPQANEMIDTDEHQPGSQQHNQ